MNIIDQVKQTLVEEIAASINKAGLADEIPDIKIEVPKDTKNGDYATNIAMVLTKIAKRNPREIAQAIVDNLDTEKAHVKQIDIAGPGFINFYLDNQYLTAIIPEAIEKGDRFGHVNESKVKMYCLSMFQLTLQEIYILVMLEMQQLVMLQLIF